MGLIRLLPRGTTEIAVPIDHRALQLLGVELVSEAPLTLACWHCEHQWQPNHRQGRPLRTRWWTCPQRHYRSAEEAFEQCALLVHRQARSEFTFKDKVLYSQMANMMISASVLFPMAANARGFTKEQEAYITREAMVLRFHAKRRGAKWVERLWARTYRAHNPAFYPHHKSDYNE